MQEEDPTCRTIPVLQERVSVEKRPVQTGRVRVRITTETETVPAAADLVSETVEVTRVPIGREIAEAPVTRTEGDVTIIPVVEEVLVVEKRLVLREEIHLRRRSASERFSADVPLRRQTATVERNANPADTDEPNQRG